MSDLVEFIRARVAEDELKIDSMTQEKVRVDTAPIFRGHPLARGVAAVTEGCG